MLELRVSEFVQRIPKYILDIAEELQNHGFEAHLVGGSVRDILLGLIPDDYDVATNALPHEIEKIFPKSIPTGATFGTITVVLQDDEGETRNVEITTYRSEEDYVGGRWPSKIEFTRNIYDDLKRRDFTINAIALNLQEFDNPDISIQQILIDPFDGISDLKRKIIRACGNPIERFSEDGLRAVRACRLAAQLNFTIEPNTLNAISKTLNVTKHISVERFRDELLKLLRKANKPSTGLRLMQQTGILEIFIPELVEGVGVTQPGVHAYDVFEHSILAVDFAEDSVKLAALFHDIGKPFTKTVDEKGVHFYGHDVKGAEITKKIMQRLKFPKSEIERVSKLVRWHMFYYPSADWRKEKIDQGFDPNQKTFFEKHDDTDTHGWSDAAIRRFIRNVGGEDAVEDLMKLRIADASANPLFKFNPKELDALAERIAQVRSKDMAISIKDLDINGEDIKKHLKISAGPIVGKILNALIEEVIDDPLLNSKDLLLQKAEEYYKKLKNDV
ncbi:MAG: HDIG domain-containing protein [Candidatus Dojkabacteria bacterium]|nr:MAG: HDIG domain-containing protein [Candidatus Dojkabacteria bacterium]